MEENFSKHYKPEPLRIREALQDMTGWEVNKGRLEKMYHFKDFTSAILFINKIVNPIEENQNYPKILITYDRVFVSLFTVAAGGITRMDIDMAREFDQLAGEAGTPAGHKITQTHV